MGHSNYYYYYYNTESPSLLPNGGHLGTSLATGSSFSGTILVAILAGSSNLVFLSLCG